MRNAVKLGISAMIVVLTAGAAYGTVQYRRHVMPEVVVDMPITYNGNKAPALMVIYGERGDDPLRDGPLNNGRRISQCRTVGSRCVSSAARKEWSAIGERRQSLQIRLFNGVGNPIIGGFQWTGPWHPDQVRVTCDLRVTEVRRACAIAGVTT